MGPRTLYLFGSQALAFTPADFLRIQAAASQHPHLQWVSTAVAELPDVVERYSQTNPLPQKILADARSFSQWFSTGICPYNARPLALPNVVLTPLVVLGHLIEYTQLIQTTTAAPEPESEAFGLCTGLLSAFAVAASRNADDIARYGSVALRLAALIGAIVDAQEDQVAAGPSKSFATAWNNPLTHDQVADLAAAVPNTYMAVKYDDCRATCTTSAASSLELQRKLQTAGVTATEVGLHGRFHWEGHAAANDAVLAFCREDTRYHFPALENLAFLTRSNQRNALNASDKLHEVAIRSILSLQPQWLETFTDALEPFLARQDSLIITLGSERSVPPSLLSKVRSRLRNAAEFASPSISLDSVAPPSPYDKEDDIAIVGMSCKVAGAQSVEEFWELLCDGKSQHREVPTDRFDFASPFRRKDPKRTWYGNFIDDYDSFDHKFFKKSPREAASTDPQQRQLLQLAYQAVQQSGYFRKASPEANVGCYIGVCSVDYENNVACHEPNAYSAIGNLKGFIAGKVSHYFGWTGPGLTIDTACSSSAVAIHQACRSILSGECEAALAGGTHVMTSPLWFQNLAGASFLSPTGSCKPFDAAADGYCRGEGVATVFLKRMSTALADGDTIFATIAATAVQQNQNHTPIFVPNSPSLSNLFHKVTARAELKPEQITVVEAHGTGTPVGDPVEYNSVREVLACNKRSTNIALSSVKGLVGHLECTSGVISLIKVVLMMMKAAIPPQASFKVLNPAIKALPTDQITIPTTLLPWPAEFKAALINNYGASGSNASIIVKQARPRTEKSVAVRHKYPFCFTALDRKGLCKYIEKFRAFLHGQKSDPTGSVLRDVCFNLLRESNRTLPEHLIVTAASIPELDEQLRRYEQTTVDDKAKSVPHGKPVIFCFGGQSAAFVGMNRNVYDQSKLLQKHLGLCDSVCTALGVSSIFPDIFKRSKVDDLVLLHAMLFSLQYSCARAWMDSGVVPAAMVGHSFGELTALAVSGTLDVEDCLKAIVGRARTIQTSWGKDSGAMVAVEGDLAQVEHLLQASNGYGDQEKPAAIACYNGIRLYTIAGSQDAINRVSETQANHAAYSSIRIKPLNVTHAYHSILANPLMDAVEKSAGGVEFKTPQIPLERSTKSISDELSTPRFFAEHMRKPVYFSHAVSRLVEKHPSAVWLEAGSTTSVTRLVQRSIADTTGHYFQGLDIIGENALDSLSEATASLWRAGIPAAYWLHHHSQAQEYAPLVLPPYQFEKARHWMEQKQPPLPASAPVPRIVLPVPDSLLSFVGYTDAKCTCARFKVNTNLPIYEKRLSGHTIAETAPICPATLQLDFAIEATRTLLPESAMTGFYPEIQTVQNHAPLCRDLTRSLSVVLESNAQKLIWSFKIITTGQKNSDIVTHTTGRLVLRDSEDIPSRLEFARYERLRSHERCVELLGNANASEIIQGRNIYRAFSDVVDYGTEYQGLAKLVGQDLESAGKVSQPYNDETWLDPLLSDAFCQVAGIYANCMTDRSPEDMYLACDIELWMRSPKLQKTEQRPDSYHVLASHSRPANDTLTSDVFVFDANKGTLVEVILGIRYRMVKKLSMRRILARLTPGISAGAATPMTSVRVSAQETKTPTVVLQGLAPTLVVKQQVTRPKLKRKSSDDRGKRKISDQINAILSTFLGLELPKIQDSSDLADLGVDSLMAMEMVSEIERKMSCILNMDEVAEVTTVAGLIACVLAALPTTNGGGVDLETPDDGSETDSSNLGSDSSLTDSTLLTAATTPAELTVDVAAHLAQFLGIDQDEIKPEVVLRDLGVDSLLAIELRADLASTFDIEVTMDSCLEDLTVGELGCALGGSSTEPVNNTAHMPKHEVLKTSPVVPVRSVESSLKAGSRPLEVVNGNPLQLPVEVLQGAFAKTKAGTDDQFANFNCQDYVSKILPQKNELCIALIVEALEKLGCNLQSAKEGQELRLVECRPEDKHLRDYLYLMLEKEAALISLVEGKVYRSAKPLNVQPSKQIRDRMLLAVPGEAGAIQLTYYAGSNLAEVLSGKTDGIKLIFGSAEGRKLVSALYGEWPINRLMYKQIEDFFTNLSDRLSPIDGTLHILEMGAGTGGTTQWLIPLLAKLSVRVEYTFTDLAPSFVAAARKRFADYDFVKYRTHDIEKPPPDDLISSQHVVIASNAVHATHNLTRSTANIRQFLRPDGALMMVEMTTPVLWVDIIFGLFEGWWFFDDGRKHAVTSEEDWKRHLLAAGYGAVDWTDGQRQENKLEKLIIACMQGGGAQSASTVDTTIAPTFPKDGLPESVTKEYGARKAKVESYVEQIVSGFDPAAITARTGSTKPSSGICVLVTGGSGSLGAHLVSNLVERDDVQSVICLNRPHKGDPQMHQLGALISRGILVSSKGLSKLRTFEGDMTQPMLGLSEDIYTSLLKSVTCIVHNAWTMSAKRPIAGFEAQFRIMGNLVALASDIVPRRFVGEKLHFLFVSSIAVVGHYPQWKATPHVPEERVSIEAVLPNGYGDAKWACELALDRTLHKYPNHFATSVVRLGQIAGSRKSGYWNPMEHSAFLWKSSQTLKALPAFEGLLSWTPVDDVAGTLADLSTVRNPHPIYNIDNPIRQAWSEMIPVLAKALAIPTSNIIPFADWVARVRDCPAVNSQVNNNGNPAFFLVEFLEDNFLRMSCGGLLLETEKAREHSATLRNVQPVSEEVARRFVQGWKDMRFLS